MLQNLVPDIAGLQSKRIGIYMREEQRIGLCKKSGQRTKEYMILNIV
jgi:hypothetical protein